MPGRASCCGRPFWPKCPGSSQSTRTLWTRRVVGGRSRHGFLPEREVMTGIGTVPVQVPRVRDRGANEDGSKIRFRPALVPRYLRKAKSVEELLPWLYLKGISTGDFSEALAALLGPEAEGLSASTTTRLKATWWEQYETWRKRDLSGRRYVVRPLSRTIGVRGLTCGGRGLLHAAAGR